MTWARKHAARLAAMILAAAVLLFLLLSCYGGRESARFENRRFHAYSARGLKPVRESAGTSSNQTTLPLFRKAQ